jgi:hypothetical protein
MSRFSLHGSDSRAFVDQTKRSDPYQLRSWAGAGPRIPTARKIRLISTNIPVSSSAGGSVARQTSSKTNRQAFSAFSRVPPAWYPRHERNGAGEATHKRAFFPIRHFLPLTSNGTVVISCGAFFGLAGAFANFAHDDLFARDVHYLADFVAAKADSWW